MKILVIPDIHCRKFWRQAIANNTGQVDKIVFLGDYLDPYSNEIKENPESMECDYFGDYDSLIGIIHDIVSLKENEPDKYVLLTGNHTDSYIWKDFSSATRTDWKHWDIYHEFLTEVIDNFQLMYVQDNVIFSHAGIVEGWANKYIEELEINDANILDLAKVLSETQLKDFSPLDIKMISNISWYRGGDYFYGSSEWADLREHIDMKKSITEVVPKGVEGIYQVFGHTQLQAPLITSKWACLDCRRGFIFDTETYECKDCL